MISAPPASGLPFTPGEVAAPGYRIIAHMARGRWMDVYDAWSDERGCRCILKMPRRDRNPREGRRRLEREGRPLLELSHPHLVRAYELLSEPFPVLVLETLAGETLARLLERRRLRLRLADVAMLGLHVSSALGYLHRKGWLHLDLKPANIVVEQGRAKVIDLSHVRRPGRARPGAGTRDYLAPEQARGATVSEATDVWGLGVVLFESVTGRPLFDSEASEAAGGGRYPQLHQRAGPVRAQRRQVSPAFAAVLDSCLDLDPAGRPTLIQVDAVLRQVAGSEGGPSVTGS